jgi:hypothetical protein
MHTLKINCATSVNLRQNHIILKVLNLSFLFGLSVITLLYLLILFLHMVLLFILSSKTLMAFYSNNQMFICCWTHFLILSPRKLEHVSLGNIRIISFNYQNVILCCTLLKRDIYQILTIFDDVLCLYLD